MTASRRSLRGLPTTLVVGGSLVLAASSCTTTVAVTPAPPPPVRIRIDRQARSIPQGLTYAALAEREDLHARDGRLLSVTGDVLERHISEGHVKLNGLEPDPMHLLAPGDRIALVDGEDRTEGTTLVRTRVPGRANAFVQRTLVTYRRVQEIATVGRRSGQVIDVRVTTAGPRRIPKAVALTFDDGPWPGDTEGVLRALRRARVEATFFMVGSLAAEHPDLVRKVLLAGHEIANHSFTHPVDPPLAEISDRRVATEIARTAEALRGAGADPTLFRPPGGSIDDTVLLEAWRQQERVVMWSVDPHDWDASRTPKQIAKDVLRRVRPGSIVLLHDGGGDGADTIEALPRIVRGIRKMGLDLVTIDPYRRG
ncbi:MAG: polysaccharide deacetylase family protein [Actinomycetota bacterium]